MDDNPRIEINRDVMAGKPVVRGTRITVEQILRKLAAGMSSGGIIEQHPRLTRGDIHAAKEFAASHLARQ